MKYFYYLIFCFFNASFCFSQDKITTQVIAGSINSKFQDVRPIISDDGKILYFNRRNHPENQKGEKDFQDVWKSSVGVNGKFGKPINLGEPYNDKKINDLVRVSESGDSMIFINTDYKGIRSTLALFYKNSKEAQPIEIDGYYNKSAYVDFDINFKENVILMAVDRKDTKGDQDLYYSLYQPESKTYSTPMSMGPVINSTEADFAPFLTKDGYTLFFVSYGHKGQGGSDIFMSQRQSDAWDDWSVPQNLGNVINSPFEETFVSIDPSLKYLYYDSYPPNATNRDIWMAELNQEIIDKIKNSASNKKAYVAGVTAATEISKASQFGEVDSAKVISAKEETVIAEADKQDQSDFTTSYVEDDNSSTDETTKENTNSNDTEPIKELSFLEKIGEKLGISNNNIAEIKLLDYGRKGKKVNHNVYFKFDSDKYQNRYNSLIKAISELMEANPELKLIIEGHTDGIGGEDINMDLSCRRAKNVKAALLNYGLSTTRLEISCEGKERPLATNDDEFEGREYNRRVEFYLF